MTLCSVNLTLCWVKVALCWVKLTVCWVKFALCWVKLTLCCHFVMFGSFGSPRYSILKMADRLTRALIEIGLSDLIANFC